MNDSQPTRLLRSQDPSTLPEYLRELKSSKLVTLSFIPPSKRKIRGYIEPGTSTDIPINILSKSPSLLIPISSRRRSRQFKARRLSFKVSESASPKLSHTPNQNFRQLFPNLHHELATISSNTQGWTLGTSKVALLLKNYTVFHEHLRKKQKESRCMHNNLIKPATQLEMPHFALTELRQLLDHQFYVNQRVGHTIDQQNFGKFDMRVDRILERRKQVRFLIHLEFFGFDDLKPVDNAFHGGG
ncbi:hypothetical protein OGAPHI_002041 [Ogataea philodendri]|uniref:Uncharacterized protein n=1 Tax=Ogataea philodendri TaxID=1378263 RepID=A0A9P8PAH1_9ASCO|nr:uncharacterized protein OGAPHI_002041 [Ogataea philodendri]KAH3668287.1 hypothetical protein OGAPHI_002041 [Ogataea philodendri]